jgi:hypothetical protein
MTWITRPWMTPKVNDSLRAILALDVKLGRRQIKPVAFLELAHDDLGLREKHELAMQQGVAKACIRVAAVREEVFTDSKEGLEKKFAALEGKFYDPFTGVWSE